MHTCAKMVSQILAPDLLSKSFCAALLFSQHPCCPDVRAIALFLSSSAPHVVLELWDEVSSVTGAVVHPLHRYLFPRTVL